MKSAKASTSERVNCPPAAPRSRSSSIRRLVWARGGQSSALEAGRLRRDEASTGGLTTDCSVLDPRERRRPGKRAFRPHRARTIVPLACTTPSSPHRR